MNIETLQDHINAFNREIIDSGFKRDIDDYINSLPTVQSNIVSLRDIAVKTSTKLDRLYSGDLPEIMSALLPDEKVLPFTDYEFEKDFKKLVENTEIPQAQFYAQLHQLLTQLRNQLTQNATEIKKIEGFITPYLNLDSIQNKEKGVAILSISFKEEKTISSLKLLTKTFTAWNRTLPIYHELLKSESPSDIEVVEVQNGSIDLVLKLDCKVAVNLAELFKVGFQCYVAFLSYKTLVKQITGTYRGNPKLLKSEQEREQDLLGNIGSAIEDEVNVQHDKAKKADKKIGSVAIKKKIEQITQLVTSHIIKGNDVKLLTDSESTEGEEEADSLANQLRNASEEARSKLRLLPTKARKELLDKYSDLPQEEKGPTEQQ